VRLGILGPLLVVGDDGAECAVGAARHRTLLAALLVRANRLVPVAELAEIVWDGAPPAGAVRTLRSYAVRLRRSVGPVVAARIVTHDPGYLCRIGDDELDSLRFDRLRREGAAAVQGGAWPRARAALGEALALWRGAPLADIGSRRLREECTQHLEQARLQVLGWRIEADLHLGRHEELVPELHALVTAHPLREQGHAQLMLALHRGGRRAEALHAFERARRLLADELGVEPGEQLRDMHRRILAGEPSIDRPPGRGDRRGAVAPPAVVVPRQLPPAVGHFTGRAAELRRLSALARRARAGGGAVVVSAIGGTAGIGKTALALHWAHQAAAEFPDGQLYVNLRGFEPSGQPLPPATVVRRFLDALGVAAAAVPADPDGQFSLYRSLLADRRALIVLDNARDVEQVRPLLPGSGGSLVLVTSRDRLTGLIAVDGAVPLELAPLTAADAYQLLARRLGAARAGRERAAVAALAGLCAHLPLALNIAAAHAIAHPGAGLAALVEEVQDAQRRLDLLSTTDAAADIRAVFSWSYATLRPPAARLFRLLGLHPGPDIGVAAGLSLAGDPDDRETYRALDELAAAHLLNEVAPGRYAFHDLLRAYAAEQARRYDTGDEHGAAVRRMLDHYLHTARTASLLLFPARDPVSPPAPAAGARPEEIRDPGHARSWLDAQRPVLVAAAALAEQERLDPHAWQLPTTLAAYLERSGHWPEYLAVQRSALAAAERAGDLSAEANAHCLLGRACATIGSHRDGEAHLGRALELYRSLQDPTGQAHTEHSLGWLAGRQGRHRDALDHAHESLGLYEAAGHRTGQARALNTVGWYRSLLGRHREALAYCRQALDLHRELGNHDGEADAWDSLGHAHHHLGHLAEAVACYRQALDLFRTLGDRHQQADVLARLGDIQLEAGDRAAAAEAWGRAVAIMVELHHPGAGALRARLAAVGNGSGTG
jgi:DNA-binding SARP family transcriptional activator/tetratricopeptide (TPR) repeat protein